MSKDLQLGPAEYGKIESSSSALVAPGTVSKELDMSILRKSEP